MATPDAADPAALLDRIERYYDAVPRSSARVEDFGPLSLFVQSGAGWPYYARPAAGWTGPVTAPDVDRVRARQRELGIPESFEWVAEVSPALRAAIEASGLPVTEHPLMALATDAVPSVPSDAVSADAVRSDAVPAYSVVEVRMIDADDPLLAAALSVPRLAFAEPGTAIGKAGPVELAAEVGERAADGTVARIADRIRAGLTATAAAIEGDVVLCSGQHQPVGDVSEIVGVGTLPAARRRGLAAAVTRKLAADARARGVEIIFLSASDDDVARVYARQGFRRIGTALIAEAD
jgi:ribosomal protein S18 acetylase RimI-like enzyme